MNAIAAARRGAISGSWRSSSVSSGSSTTSSGSSSATDPSLAVEPPAHGLLRVHVDREGDAAVALVGGDRFHRVAHGAHGGSSGGTLGRRLHKELGPVAALQAEERRRAEEAGIGRL